MTQEQKIAEDAICYLLCTLEVEYGLTKPELADIMQDIITKYMKQEIEK